MWLTERSVADRELVSDKDGRDKRHNSSMGSQKGLLKQPSKTALVKEVKVQNRFSYYYFLLYRIIFSTFTTFTKRKKQIKKYIKTDKEYKEIQIRTIKLMRLMRPVVMAFFVADNEAFFVADNEA